MPAMALALGTMAVFSRLIRSDMIATLKEDYILSARAKGLSDRYILFRHALRPSSLSLMTIVGINFGALLGGTVVIETLFAVPGLGFRLINAINQRDILVIQGITVFVAAVYVIINTIVDLLYADLTPFSEKTRFGIAFMVSLVGFGAVAALVIFAWTFGRRQLLWPALIGSALLASGFSLSGHQATEPNSTWATQLADWLHLVAASVWAGGVLALAVIVWPLAPGLRRAAFLGFSRIAVGLVAVLVATGLTGLFGLPTVVLGVVLALLALASLVTVVQRILTVRRQALGTT